MKKGEGNFIIAIIIVTIIILIGLTCFICFEFNKPNYFASYGQFGDWIGGVIGTIISFFTLVVICYQLNQVKEQLGQNEKQLKLQNEQSLQSTVALLLQAYQHTIEDFDYEDTLHGREAIKASLKKRTDKDYLSEFFPTHIPAIIVSILYTIKDSNLNSNKKDNLYRQIKTMLSFEERQLLLLYLLELHESKDEKDKDEDYSADKDLLKEAIFTNGEESKAIKEFKKEYRLIYLEKKTEKI
jgi:uncharacterized membrane protein